MLRFILMRILAAIPVLVVLSIVTFIIIKSQPGDYGDYIRSMLMNQGHATYAAAEAQAEAYRASHGLNLPLPLQYLRWIWGIVTQFDFGQSFFYNRPVGQVVAERLPRTILLAMAAMLIATVIGVALGVLAAVKRDTWMDSTAIFTSVLGISAPSFFMGIVIAYVFGFVLSDYTGLHLTGNLYDTDAFAGRQLQLRNLILPAITLGIRPMAIIAQLTRGSLLDVLDQDYIRTAYAKGLSKSVVVWKHGLRNALNPVITAITGWFAELLAGAFFVEYIFGWKGIGKVTVDALELLDFPVVMGSVLVSSFFFILIGLLADALYGLIDPRVRKA